jgi:hypothetical protein
MANHRHDEPLRSGDRDRLVNVVQDPDFLPLETHVQVREFPQRAPHRERQQTGETDAHAELELPGCQPTAAQGYRLGDIDLHDFGDVRYLRPDLHHPLRNGAPNARERPSIWPDSGRAGGGLW